MIVKIQLGLTYSKYKKDVNPKAGRIVKGKKVLNSSYIKLLTNSSHFKDLKKLSMNRYTKILNDKCKKENEPNEKIKCIHNYDKSESIMTRAISHIGITLDDFNQDDADLLKNYECSYYKVYNFGKYEITKRTNELANLIADYVTSDKF